MIECIPYFNTATLYFEKSHLYCNNEHKIQKINNLLKPEFMSWCWRFAFQQASRKRKFFLL